VSSFDLGFAVDLERLMVGHAMFATYEPELFPGLVYRLPNPTVTLLVFVSGRVSPFIHQLFTH
jgi:transcription initiation factor TFIID TATA-box-binding protein